MPISTNAAIEDKLLCRGGQSFNCRRIVEEPGRDSYQLGPHDTNHRGRDTRLYCRRCSAYMGCFWCAQQPPELVCLRCHDWATDAGERRHGKMVNPELARDKLAHLTKSVEQRVFVTSRKPIIKSEHQLDRETEERRAGLREQAKLLGVDSAKPDELTAGIGRA